MAREIKMCLCRKGVKKLLLAPSEFKGNQQLRSQKIQGSNICSDDLPPLIFVYFLVASAIVCLSFLSNKSSVWLERQFSYPVDGCIHGSFILSPLRLLTLPCMANNPIHSWSLTQLCHL